LASEPKIFAKSKPIPKEIPFIAGTEKAK